MKTTEKIKALIDAYIELGENEGYSKQQIFDSLLDIFDEGELRELGYTLPYNEEA